MLIKLHNVPTSDLREGDIVVTHDLGTDAFVSAETIEGSNYLRLTWRDDSFIWTTTAQPWDEWPAVIREA